VSDTGHITRTNMPSGYPTTNLDLFTPDSLGDPAVATIDFVMDGLDPGAPAKRRQIAESMYVVGFSQLASVAGEGQGRLGLFVTGRTRAVMEANIDELVAAVTLQPTWELHVAANGGPERAWTYVDADPPTVGFGVPWWTGGQGVSAGNQIFWAPVTVSALRYPIPVAGGV
jgi:hypothetical protein